MQNRGLFLLLTLLFGLAFCFGTWVYPRCSTEQREFLQAVLQLQQESRGVQVAVHCLCYEGLQLLILFFCGFCAIGQPLAIFLLGYRGLGFGLCAACFAQQGKGAYLYYLIAVLPETCLFLFLQITAIRESLSFSLFFLRPLFGINGLRGSTVAPRIYILRFFLLFLLMSLFSVVAMLLHQLWSSGSGLV